jgi:protein TonB
MKSIKMILMVLFVSAGCIQMQAQENKSKDGVYNTVEEMPEYPGGENAFRNDIASEVKYPEEAKKNNIQGKVFVSFVVNEQGKVEDAKIERGVDSLLDDEALRVVKSLKTWKPGKEKGKAVKVAYTVPINFALAEKSESKNEKK